MFEVLEQPRSEVIRDASIKRFEYSFETTWHAAQAFLAARHGVEAGSPKSVLREAGKVGLLGEESLKRMLLMTDDRNQTTHTYREDLADEIYARLPEWAALANSLLEAMEKEL